MAKRLTSIRLSKESDEILEKLKERKGKTQTQIIEDGLKMLYWETLRLEKLDIGKGVN